MSPRIAGASSAMLMTWLRSGDGDLDAAAALPSALLTWSCIAAIASSGPFQVDEFGLGTLA